MSLPTEHSQQSIQMIDLGSSNIVDYYNDAGEVGLHIEHCYDNKYEGGVFDTSPYIALWGTRDWIPLHQLAII